jgi:hypothetical protein
MLKFLTWGAGLALITFSAQAQQSVGVELANLREDVRILTQKVGSLTLTVEDLQRENAALRTQTANATSNAQAYATVQQLNDAVSSLDQAMKSGDAAASANAAAQIKKLGEATNAALDSITKGQAIGVAVAMIGVLTVHPNKLRAARVFGATGFRLFAHVTLPAALPHVLTGARLAMMNSFMTIIAAEMVAARQGLGFLIFNSRQWMEVDAIFVGMITLGLLGLLADRLMALLTRLLFRRFRPADV